MKFGNVLSLVLRIKCANSYHHMEKPMTESIARLACKQCDTISHRFLETRTFT